MRNHASEEMNILKNSQLDISHCCQATLENLKEKPWQAIIKKIAHNWRTRNRLSQLNEAQLKDIGLTAADVDHEVNKPLWK
ncbi:DUF1127 domain-containing protein [Marinomonas sp. M1K-6]|uniref:DUF1127 domain-containing protein n=1 Tax=Marinomonas profundi TaxID=2726122 RepID=A0A847QYZ2_9GAMM|nr:DUF1127 domain-containing protein [Marinomonas profundi]NLQ18429.1 DUF1127 domain-containing protein [Marinomonas profundi]UDV02751.1 DUF1127 domain-containing protein [Marinomonas profundi]